MLAVASAGGSVVRRRRLHARSAGRRARGRRSTARARCVPIRGVVRGEHRRGGRRRQRRVDPPGRHLLGRRRRGRAGARPLRASGRLDSGWKVRADGGGLRDRAGRATGSTSVGLSQSSNGMARAGLAALDIRSGDMLDWQPRIAGRTKDDEAEVYAIAPHRTADGRLHRRRLRPGRRHAVGRRSLRSAATASSCRSTPARATRTTRTRTSRSEGDGLGVDRLPRSARTGRLRRR